MNEQAAKLKRWWGIALLIGLMVAPIGVTYHFNGLRLSPEAMDAAQLARNLAGGRGLATGFVRPASLLFSPRTAGHPDLYQPPLPSLFLAAVFRIFGPSDRSVALAALVLFWGGGLLAVSLTRRILGAAAAWLAAALYFTNAGLLGSVLAGDPSLLGSLLLLLIPALGLRLKAPPCSRFLIGALCGLGYLASYRWFWIGLLPLAGWGLSPLRPERGRRFNLKSLAALLGGFLLVVLPWFWRNGQVGGFIISPLRLAEYKMFTSFFPADSVLREASREVFRQGAGLPELVGKWWRGGELIYDRLLLFTGTFAAAFFWLALFLPVADRRWSRFRYFIFIGLLLGTGQFVFFARRVEDIQFLLPGAIPIAAGTFLFLLEKMNPARGWARRAAIALFVGLNLIPGLDRLQFSRPPADPTGYNCRGLRSRIEAGGVVITDQPAAMAWYGGRTALWLPAELGRAGDPAAGYLYLTPQAAESPPPRMEELTLSWPRIYRNQGRSDFWEVVEFGTLPGEQFFCRISRPTQ